MDSEYYTLKRLIGQTNTFKYEEMIDLYLMNDELNYKKNNI